MNPTNDPTATNQIPLFVQVVSWAVLASAGGAVKFISTTLKNSNSIPPRRFLFLLGCNVFISGFSGLLGAFLVSSLTRDYTWHLIAAGIFGYLGTQGIDIITLQLKNKFNSEPVPVSSVMPIPSNIDHGTPPTS